MLEKLYNEAVQKDLDITICDYDIYHNKKSTFRANSVNPYAQIYDCGVVTSKNEQPDRILLSTTGAAWNKLFKKSFLIEKELSFLGDVMMFEDVYFTVCALAFAERVGKVPDVLLHHRIYSTQSRARTFKKYYSQVPEVYLKIKEFLMKGGMYQPLHSAFLNLSASRCYHVFNLLDSGSKEKFWKLLNEEYYQKLDWHEHSAEDFDNPEICEFIANMELYTYKQYQKRCAMGKHIDQDKMNMKLKQGHRYRRLREFCASYFKKKKK